MSRPHVVVVGAGVAGLVAGYECARAGCETTVVEAAGHVGGSVARHRVAGLSVDVGAESFATRGGGVARLLNELGLSRTVVTPNPAGAWLRLPHRSVPLPQGMLGIPADLSSPAVVSALGVAGAHDAARRDAAPVAAVLPDSVGELVRSRMGPAVAGLLVSPVTGGVYSADAGLLDADAMVPGLRDAVHVEGSLAGAVRALRAGAVSKAGAAAQGLDGGMTRLVDALALRLRERHAWTRLHTRAIALTADDGAGASADGPRPAWTVHIDGGGTIPADAVIVATPGPAARALLRTTAAATTSDEANWPADTAVRIVTLVVDAPALNAAPRGTGLLVADVPGTGVAAKALTHATAKWAWLADAAGPGVHVLRLSYGRAGGAPVDGRATRDAPGDAGTASAGTPTAPAADTALRDASTLLGVPLSADLLRGVDVTWWRTTAPAALHGQRARLAAVGQAVDALPRLQVTGAWLAGTGLASVIPHARRAAADILGTFSNLQ